MSDVKSIYALNGRTDIGAVSKVILVDDPRGQSSTNFIILTSTGRVLSPSFGENALSDEVWRTLCDEDIAVNGITYAWD